MILLDFARTKVRTMADVVHDLGDIPLHRIRSLPYPATEKDRNKPENKGCELIDGVLVDKAMGANESVLGLYLGRIIGNHVAQDDLGAILGTDGFFYLEGGQIRAPDVSFIPWSALPEEKIPERGHSHVEPAVFVEVLSPDNTAAEIDRKLREFFAAGAQLAWVINPRTKSARVYTSAKRFKELDVDGTLDGGKVLPGFKLPLAELFAATRRKKK